MKYTDYLEFLSPTEIRIKGRRIGLENVLYRYLTLGETVEQIAAEYSDLAVETVGMAIDYYHNHKVEVETYMSAWLEQSERLMAKQDHNPSAGVTRLRVLKATRQVRQETM